MSMRYEQPDIAQLEALHEKRRHLGAQLEQLHARRRVLTDQVTERYRNHLRQRGPSYDGKGLDEETLALASELDGIHNHILRLEPELVRIDRQIEVLQAVDWEDGPDD